MSQRHQFFVIAKIGCRYRTLAVVHHQWLSWEGHLETCLRLILIFQAESSRVLLRQELRAAESKKDDFWASHDFQPFPVIAICLLVGSSFDGRKGHQYHVNLLAFNTTLDQVDIDSGITIIDISDLNQIKYSHCLLKDWEKGIRPLSAARAYACTCLKLLLDAHPMDPEEGYRRWRLRQVVLKMLRVFANRLGSYELIEADSLRSRLKQDVDQGDELPGERQRLPG